MRGMLWLLVVLLGGCWLQPALLQPKSMKGSNKWKDKWPSGLSEYEIVIPKRMKALKGEQYSTHFFSKRSTSSDSSHMLNNHNTLYYSIIAFKKNLDLKLKPNTNFIAPNLIIQKRGQKKNETWRIKSSPETQHYCFHTGHIDADPSSEVSVSLCGGMMGSIVVNGTHYLIEPHPNVTASNPDELLEVPHIIYKAGYPHSDNISSHCGVKSDYYKETAETLNSSSVPHRKRRAAPLYQGNDEHYVELMIVADQKMVEFHGSDLEHYLFVLMSIVSSIYKKHTIQNNINIMVVKVVLLDYREAGPHISSNAATTLHNFCKWQHSQNADDDFRNTHHDTAVLVTRTDICRSPAKCDTLGLAELGTICDPVRSCAIAEDNGLSAAFTIAHELGHVFSLPHDDDYRCRRYTQGRTDTYSLMAPTLDYSTNPWSWSTCSASELTEFLDAGHGKCLQDKPRRLQYLEQIQSNSHIKPGEQYSIDNQCRQAFGTGSKVCPYSSSDESECKRLWCTSPGIYGQDTGCRTQHMPWADGTKCGPNMWCIEGRCSHRQSASPIHGSWNEWEAYGECSRTCGGGIMKSQRECNNPAPKHGGRYCVGERVRYNSCKTAKCPASDVFREGQCAKHNGNNFNIITVGQNVKWKPKYSGIAQEDRCKLYCQAEDNSAIYYRLEAKVKDGTKCDPYTSDICVNGKCKRPSSLNNYKSNREKPAGCDNVLGSNKKRDHCGVCDGDGMSCRTVKQRYNPHSQGFGYNDITIIKKGSSSIHIEQHGYHNRKNDDNYLALKNEAGKFVLNGNYIVSMMKKEIHVKGAVLEYSGSDNVVEVISGTRPIQEDLYLMVLAVGKLYPPNVTYEYTTQDESKSKKVTAPPVPRNRFPSKYKWIKRYQRCITECGEGRKKKVLCARMPNKHVVADQYCEEHNKPKPRENGCTISLSKEKQHCEAVWRVVSQSACSSRCGQGEGYVQRQYKCFRIYSKIYRRAEIVGDKFCLVKHKKPVEKWPCTGLCQEPHWKFGEWSKCTASCDGGLQHRHSKCVDTNDEVIPDSQCGNEIRKVSQVCNKHSCPLWILEEWDQCSVTCGQGIKRRRIRCEQDGKPTSETLCEPKDETNLQMACNDRPCVQPKWHNGDWKKCSVTCGTGVKIRLVTCRKEKQILENSQCQGSQKPTTVEGCYFSKCYATTTPQTIQHSTQKTISNSTPGSSITSPKETTTVYKSSSSEASISQTSQAPDSTSNSFLLSRWRTGSWTECSVTCGRGIHGRYVSCRDSHGNMAPDSSCLNIPKPPEQEHCIAKPCGQWQIGEWSPCPVTCGTGKKTRHVACMTLEGSEQQVKSPTFCDISAMPSKDTECNTNDCLSYNDMDISSIETNRVEGTSHWRTGPWGGCSVTCGNGWRRRAVACMDENSISPYCNPFNHPKEKERCKNEACPIWRNGKWNECSEECGGGVQYRMVVCQIPKGSIVESSDCDMINKPRTSRRCNTHECSSQTPTVVTTQTPYWYKGPWSTCSISCGRGGVRTRLVLCMDIRGREISERQCRKRRKPKTKRKCRGEACPRWGIGRWGRCSVACGNGAQYRKVICLAGNRSATDPSKCSHIPKPKNSRPCKANKCGRFVWEPGRWSKCSESCGYGVRYRGVRCIDRSRNNHRVNDHYCTFGNKPKRRSRCIHKPCPRKWNTSDWSKCSRPCGEGYQIRNVTCHAISKEGWLYPTPVEGCDPEIKPSVLEVCMIRQCMSNYKWKSFPWKKCKKKCGFGIQKRKVNCVNRITGDKVSPRKCIQTYKPSKKKVCHVQNCFASSCDELKRQTGIQEDGEYRMLIQGSIVSVYCHHMSKSHPHEYITLTSGARSNYAAIFHKRLKDIESCPEMPQTCQDCFLEDTYPGAGLTYFSKVRINITSLQIVSDNFVFTTSLSGLKQVAYGEAGDCYGTSNCPQGHFRIDLQGTGFKVNKETKWENTGHNPIMRITVSENGTKMEGTCGGYCGSCFPQNRAIQLEILLANYPEQKTNDINANETEKLDDVLSEMPRIEMDFDTFDGKSSNIHNNYTSILPSSLEETHRFAEQISQKIHKKNVTDVWRDDDSYKLLNLYIRNMNGVLTDENFDKSTENMHTRFKHWYKNIHYKKVKHSIQNNGTATPDPG